MQKSLRNESWKHKVIRESFEKGYSIPRISKEFKLSITAILGEINKDIELKYLYLSNG